jgi:hypothetical protein
MVRMLYGHFLDKTEKNISRISGIFWGFGPFCVRSGFYTPKQSLRTSEFQILLMFVASLPFRRFRPYTRTFLDVSQNSNSCTRLACVWDDQFWSAFHISDFVFCIFKLKCMAIHWTRQMNTERVLNTGRGQSRHFVMLRIYYVYKLLRWHFVVFLDKTKQKTNKNKWKWIYENTEVN